MVYLLRVGVFSVRVYVCACVCVCVCVCICVCMHVVCVCAHACLTVNMSGCEARVKLVMHPHGNILRLLIITT